MKMESMAQFLIKGDVILEGRKKYEVVNVKTSDRETTVLYKTPKSKVCGLLTVKCNHFFKVISPISFSK